MDRIDYERFCLLAAHSKFFIASKISNRYPLHGLAMPFVWSDAEELGDLLWDADGAQDILSLGETKSQGKTEKMVVQNYLKSFALEIRHHLFMGMGVQEMYSFC